jgi:hypothetical protein
MTLEQQLDVIMASSAIDTMQITAQREDDGSIRFYTVVHASKLCCYSSLMNLPTVQEAIESGIKSLNERRLAAPKVGELAPMEEAA